MDITAQITARIENTRRTNKNPCKNYATKEAAMKAAQKLADDGTKYYGCSQPIRFVVFFNEAWGRWVAAFDTSEAMKRREFSGGYIAFFAGQGFYQY